MPLLRDFLFLASLLSAPAALAQTPVVQSVLHAADYSALIAPGVWAAIFGSNLAAAPVTDATLPLPMQLGGVTVTLNGDQIPLRYVSPGQINALIPFSLTAGSYNLVVTTPSGASSPFQTLLSSVAPAVYTQNATGTGMALAFDAGFNAVARVSTAPLVLYASGLGPTNPPGTAAGGNSTPPYNVLVNPGGLSVRIGGLPAQIQFAGLAPGLPGIYQLNVLPAAGVPADDTLTLVSSVSGIAAGLGGLENAAAGVYSPVTALPVASGQNTANVSGTLSVLYPTSATVLGYSALLTAATFNAAFDILPAAAPFSVVAACPGGSVSIVFNPTAGTWQSTSNVPTEAERNGDFNAFTNSAGQIITIFSFSGSSDFVGSSIPFPANIVPIALLDPAAAQAASAIPFPNYVGSLANVNYVMSGLIPAGGHFVINGSNNQGVINFGGYFNAPPPYVGGQMYRINACSLTVDGTLVSSATTTFQ